MRTILILTLLTLTATYQMAQKMPNHAGNHKLEMTLSDCSTLRYGLHIPKNLSISAPTPLIVALHYGGKVTPYYGHDCMKSYVATALSSLGAIIIAPDCPHQNWKTDQSQEAIMILIDEVKKHFAIDSSRMAITGFSMGAMGAWHTIASRPSLFSAAIVVAGKVEPNELTNAPNIPIYIIHSNADKILSYQSAKEAYNTLKIKGYNVYFKSIDGVNHYDTAGFTPSVKSAAKWLKKRWAKKKR